MSEDLCELIPPRRSLNIGIHAYECIPGLVFVRVPNERGRYMLVERCVAEVDCPSCGSVCGEPCKHKNRAGYNVRYFVGTHVVRREAAKYAQGKKSPRGPKPKLRVAADDVTAAMETL